MHITERLNACLAVMHLVRKAPEPPLHLCPQRTQLATPQNNHYPPPLSVRTWLAQPHSFRPRTPTPISPCRAPGWQSPRTAQTPPLNPTALPSHRTGSRSSYAGWQWGLQSEDLPAPTGSRRKLHREAEKQQRQQQARRIGNHLKLREVLHVLQYTCAGR